MTENSFDSPLPRFLTNQAPVRVLSSIYEHIIKIRNKQFDCEPSHSYKAPFPVISIGGIRAGGTGKTPSAILVGKLLNDMGITSAFLSRGYKKPRKGNIIAAPGEHISWLDCGDEPAMIHYQLPESWLGIGADRLSNLKILLNKVNEKAAFILDDGFQHRKICRDLDIVCLSESVLNDKLLPVGYLREPLDSLSRAHIAFLIGTIQKRSNLELIKEQLAVQFPDLDTYILFQERGDWVNVKNGSCATSLSITNPVAVCGIARPERFFATLRECNIHPHKEICFPDHHQFTLSDFNSIHKLYSKDIVTTEKDAIRLELFKDQIKSDIWALKILLRFDCAESLNRFNRKLQNLFNT